MKTPSSRLTRNPGPRLVWLAGVFIALLPCQGLPAGENGGEEVSPQQVEQLRDQIREIDQWLETAEKDRSELEQDLAGIERSISELTRERRELRQQADEETSRLARLEEREATLGASLESQRESLKKQIRAAWISGDAPAVKVLLNEIDPQRVARTMTYYEYLSRDTLQRLQAFNRTLNELRENRIASEESRQELQRLEQQAAARQDSLQERQAERERTLTALESDINTRRSEREDLEADRERLETLLREVEQAIAEIPAPNEQQPFAQLRGKLEWPVEGELARRFGDSLAQGQLRLNGQLIETEANAGVQAVHHGRVVFANWLRGFGLMTIIDHGDGYMTLYGHASSLLTSPGDWVASGEDIAIAGRSGGTERPGLYFEIRHQGRPQNPAGWLK